MTDDVFHRLDEWADDVLDEYARLSEHLTDAELTDRAAFEEANFHVLADGWVIAHPDDSRMRRYLLEEDGYDAEFADLILGKMRAIASERDRENPGWDRWAPGEIEYWKGEARS